MDAFKIQLV